MTKKWRFLVAYAVIFVALATYFFIFEVYGKRKKDEAKEAERKVFNLKAEDLQEINISRGNEQVVLIKDNDRWRITVPVETDTDNPSVMGFVNTISDLRVKKWIGKESDLSPFGLQNPSITILVKKASATSYKLVVGGKTPTEDGMYAMAFLDDSPIGKEPIFIIDTGIWGVLNKGLYELRKKELVTFENPQVRKIEIQWHGSPDKSLTIVRETEDWILPDYPKIKVKKSRVDHIVDQIRWLRAHKFVENSKVDVSSFNLNDPIVTINIDLSNRDPLKIQLGEHKNGSESTPNRLEAFSSDLPFVTLVDRYILNELPRKPDDLQDRSLFTWKEEDIGKIVWRHLGNRIEWVKEEEKDSEWKWKKGSEKGYSKLKEGWKVRSVIWAASDIEYETTKDPVKSLPDKISDSMELYGRDGKLLAEWNWQEVGSDPKGSSTIWIKASGSDEIQVFSVPSSKLKNLVDRLKSFENTTDKKSQ